MSFEIAGKLIVKGETQQVSDRFKKREFVIEKEEDRGGMTFTDSIKFQLTQDRCDLLNDSNVNDEIKVGFNIKGNRWEKNGNVNYFVNLDAWRIEKLSTTDAGAGGGASFDAPGNDAPFPSSEPDFASGDDAQDDLPF